MIEEDEREFDKFWESSNLDRFSVQQFAQRLNAYDSDSKSLSLEYPARTQLLPSVSSRINKIAKKRKSERMFSGKQLSLKELGLLLSSFYAVNGLEHRAFPSAGATYTTEIFCIAFNVEKFGGKTMYYDAKNHGVVIVGTSPPWRKAKKTLNIDVAGEPCALIVFALFQDRVMSKYGERGGRFMLLETGAAMQQLALQIAESSKIKGVAVGGVLDNVWKSFLGLENTDAKIALGYLVGK